MQRLRNSDDEGHLGRHRFPLPGWSWWRQRRWKLAQQQLLAGTPGDVALEELAEKDLLLADTANEHRIFRSITRATTRTEWRGD